MASANPSGDAGDPGDWLPVGLHPASNGEFLPPPRSPLVREVVRRTHDLAERNARRLGVSRRAFLTGLTGAAATFAVLGACAREQAAESGRAPGGSFPVEPEATIDPDAARSALSGDEFILDVQTHYVNLEPGQALPGWAQAFPQAQCPAAAGPTDARACFTVDAYLQELFVRSDTSMAILSALPVAGPGSGLSVEDMAYAIDVAQRIGCDDRLLMHGGAFPHLGPPEAALAAMADAADRYDIAAWKIYTMTPPARAFYLDDHDPDLPQVGQRFIDQVRRVGPPIICAHKGISSIVGSSPELADPSDIGPAAARNPDVAFVVYHSGFEPLGGGVGPYDPGDPAPAGVDRLIRSMEQAGLGPGSNVYAELGATWWFLMRDPTAAAHVLGKLLRYVGPDRVLWGTDSIWFGTPQDQIQALRLFAISEEFQERYGYPALTDEVKRGIFGLNAARLYGVEPVDACRVDTAELELVRASLPPAPTYGPTTAAEAARIIAAHQSGATW
jgi:predicted TIM-barrel fold metal-dependent hydrolase